MSLNVTMSYLTFKLLKGMKVGSFVAQKAGSSSVFFPLNECACIMTANNDIFVSFSSFSGTSLLTILWHICHFVFCMV